MNHNYSNFANMLDEDKFDYIIANITNDHSAVNGASHLEPTSSANGQVMIYLYDRNDVHIHYDAPSLHDKFVQKLKSVSHIPYIYTGLLYDWISYAIYLDSTEDLESYIDLTYKHYANKYIAMTEHTVTPYISLPWKKCLVCGDDCETPFCPLHRNNCNVMLCKDVVCNVCGDEQTFVASASYLKDNFESTGCVIETLPCHEHTFTIRVPLSLFERDSQ